ncbi:hypothetical protein [uncultured Paraglaciecola sp.]|uniref:hypothetical protein n=1 Tax=uncultured Paraglaciecola sp. TaxID=1765024 RepID=UPI0030DB4311|tara:strand:+ start:122737 stop:123240 length:504 start_codon:yes stop_codon:yes gene_type:complete
MKYLTFLILFVFSYAQAEDKLGQWFFEYGNSYCSLLLKSEYSESSIVDTSASAIVLFFFNKNLDGTNHRHLVRVIPSLATKTAQVALIKLTVISDSIDMELTKRDDSTESVYHYFLDTKSSMKLLSSLKAHSPIKYVFEFSNNSSVTMVAEGNDFQVTNKLFDHCST